jgi:hypothetical protein
MIWRCTTLFKASLETNPVYTVSNRWQTCSAALAPSTIAGRRNVLSAPAMTNLAFECLRANFSTRSSRPLRKVSASLCRPKWHALTAAPQTRQKGSYPQWKLLKLLRTPSQMPPRLSHCRTPQGCPCYDISDGESRSMTDSDVRSPQPMSRTSTPGTAAIALSYE